MKEGQGYPCKRHDMMMMMIVSLKILTRTFCNCLSYKKVLILAKRKELSNSQKALIVKLWNDGESRRNISSNQNIPFMTIGSFIARFKRRNRDENKKQKKKPKKKKNQVLQGRFLLHYQEN